MLTRTSFLLTSSFVSLLSFHAPAQGGDAKAAPPQTAAAALSETLKGMARAEYEAGKILYADGDFVSAAMKFERAYEESKDPRLLWNVAVAEKNLRHYVRVHALVQRYLAEAGAQLPESDRSDAQALLDTVKGFIGEVSFDVEPAGATISVDDQPIGVAPLPGPVSLEMGERRIRVKKPGFLEFSTTHGIGGGSASRITAKLQAELHEGRLRVVASPGDTIRVDGRVAGIGQWDGALPSGIHSVQVTAEGKRTYQSDVGIHDGQLASVRVALEEKTSLAVKSENSRLGSWPWVLGGVAIAGLGVGAYFLFRPSDDSREPPVAGTLDPGSIPLALRF